MATVSRKSKSRPAPRSKPKSSASDKHPDQLDELITAKAMPVEILPREQHPNHEARVADVRECYRLLATIAGEMRDAQNAMVAEWLGYHFVAGTALRVAAWESAIDPLPSDLFLAMYHSSKGCAPTAAGDILTCALNWLVRTIRTQTSPKLNLKRWRAVLLPRNRERPWFWGGPQPIRLSPATTKFERVGDELHVVVRAVRGGTPIRLRIKGKVGTSRPGGPGANGQKYNERFDVLSSVLAANGAMLTESAGRWHFTFLDRKAAPRLPVRDDLQTMFLRTSAEAGWRVRLAGRSAYLISGDKLADLANARRRQIARRSELKERGVDSRSKDAQIVKHLWSNYCRTLNQQTASEVVAWCVKHGIERIAVMAGDEWCALAALGNDELDAKEPTRFPLAEFASILRAKAMQSGIVVVSRPNLRSAKRRKEMWERKLARVTATTVAT